MIIYIQYELNDLFKYLYNKKYFINIFSFQKYIKHYSKLILLIIKENINIIIKFNFKIEEIIKLNLIKMKNKNKFFY